MKIYSEKKAEDFLKKNVSVAESILTKSKKNALEFVSKRKYNAVMKIISDKAIHKTDVGGVKICKDLESFEKGFDSLVRIGNKLKYDGILVQEFLSGHETLIGIKKDPSFGHVILFGMGGVAVEVLKDVSFRVCPIDEKEALAMINETKMSALLNGYRGMKKSNIKLLAKSISKISKLVISSKIKEMDINPMIVNDKVAKVADARIVFDA